MAPTASPARSSFWRAGLGPAHQAAHFGCVYGADGGVFIVRSVARGALVDRVALGRLDLLDTVICPVGAAINL